MHLYFGGSSIPTNSFFNLHWIDLSDQYTMLCECMEYDPPSVCHINSGGNITPKEKPFYSGYLRMVSLDEGSEISCNIEQFEREGVVGPSNGSKPRSVKIGPLSPQT